MEEVFEGSCSGYGHHSQNLNKALSIPAKDHLW